MAAHNWQEIKALSPGLIVIGGSFAPNGASAVSATSRKGMGWSVARTGTGQFTITFNDKFVDLVSAIATLQLNAAAASVVQVGAWDSSAKTLILTVLTESAGALAAADVAANANNRIHFEVKFSNTSIVPVRG